MKTLKLAEDPAIISPPKTWISEVWSNLQQILSPTKGTESNNEPSKDIEQSLLRQEIALETLSRNLRISRIGRTFVLQVEYRSPSPVRAAEIANAYTEAYLLEQMNLRVGANRRARSWLEQRTAASPIVDRRRSSRAKV